MEIVLALLPYLTAGFCAAVVSRFTGVALSFIVVPTLLIWGATPAELVSFMLTFAVYNGLPRRLRIFA